MTITSEMKDALAKAASDIAEIIKRYVDDEVKRDEQERAGDYIQQMRKNIKLTRKMRSRSIHVYRR